MARAAVQLGVREIAEQAGVSPATVIRVERGRGEANPATLAAIRTAYESLGVEFIGEHGAVYRGKPREI